MAAGHPDTANEHRQDLVRVAAAQYALGPIGRPDEFRRRITQLARAAAGYAADFLVLPELITMQLLAAEPPWLDPADAVARVAGHSVWLTPFLRELATGQRINIVGGSHITRMPDGSLQNVATIALRDGRIHTQPKLHPTPSEAEVWGIRGGDRLDVIETDCGPVGVLICYDAEFPEPVRHLVDHGARLLLVPFCTDDRRGYLRVRHCCHARAIESQIYVVMAGLAGMLPGVVNMDVHYAESAILTPCDLQFPWNGVAAEAPANVETLVVADLSLAALDAARRAGSVRNLADRRNDLYRVEWRGNDSRSD